MRRIDSSDEELQVLGVIANGQLAAIASLELN